MTSSPPEPSNRLFTLGPFLYDAKYFILPKNKADRAALRKKDPSKIADKYFHLYAGSVRPVAKFSWQKQQIMKELTALGLLNIVEAKKRIILAKAAISNSKRLTAANAVRNHYLGLGCLYIQIAGYGLFYLGPGNCPYGVTSFEPTACFIRLRLKPHAKNQAATITLSLNIPCKVLDVHSRTSYSLDPRDNLSFPSFLFMDAED